MKFRLKCIGTYDNGKLYFATHVLLQKYANSFIITPILVSKCKAIVKYIFDISFKVTKSARRATASAFYFSCTQSVAPDSNAESTHMDLTHVVEELETSVIRYCLLKIRWRGFLSWSGHHAASSEAIGYLQIRVSMCSTVIYNSASVSIGRRVCFSEVSGRWNLSQTEYQDKD